MNILLFDTTVFTIHRQSTPREGPFPEENTDEHALHPRRRRDPRPRERPGRHRPHPRGADLRRRSGPPLPAQGRGPPGRPRRASRRLGPRGEAGLLGRDALHPAGELEGRAPPRGPPRSARRDHRPAGPQDGHQRPQLRGELLHGRPGGLQLPHLGELPGGSGQPAGRGPGHHRADRRAPRQALLPQRRDRGAPGPPPRLAPLRGPPPGRRPSPPPPASSTSASTSSTTPGGSSRTARAPISTCRRWRATSRPGSGTRSSSAPSRCSGSPSGPSRPPS